LFRICRNHFAARAVVGSNAPIALSAWSPESREGRGEPAVAESAAGRGRPIVKGG
jgi:hypothetical protein